MFPRLKNKLKAKTEHASSVSLNSLRKTHGHVMRRDSKQVKKKCNAVRAYPAYFQRRFLPVSEAKQSLEGSVLNFR